MARSICLVIGYASLALSLSLPTNVPSPGGGFYRGWQSFVWVIMLSLGSIVDLAQLPAWPNWSLSDVMIIFCGLMYIWLLGGCLCLLSKSALLRLISATWGYAGFVILVISDAQSYHGFSASDVFLYLSYLFVATGMLLSVPRREHE